MSTSQPLPMRKRSAWGVSPTIVPRRGTRRSPAVTRRMTGWPCQTANAPFIGAPFAGPVPLPFVFSVATLRSGFAWLIGSSNLPASLRGRCTGRYGTGAAFALGREYCYLRLVRETGLEPRQAVCANAQRVSATLKWLLEIEPGIVAA